MFSLKQRRKAEISSLNSGSGKRRNIVLHAATRFHRRKKYNSCIFNDFEIELSILFESFSKLFFFPDQ